MVAAQSELKAEPDAFPQSVAQGIDPGEVRQVRAFIALKGREIGLQVQVPEFSGVIDQNLGTGRRFVGCIVLGEYKVVV